MVVPSAVLAAGGSSTVSGAMPVGALTQFVVATIGTQTAGTAFTITTITAEDAAGNTVTTLTGTVALTETGGGAGGTVSPATSGSFVLGVLTNQSVTLTKAGSGVTITATNGSTGSSAAFLVNPGTAAKLQVLMPGETAAAGSTTGKTGSPSTQTAGVAVTVTVNAVDANWNLVSSTHTIAITATDASAVLPANAALVAGTKTFSVTLTTASSTGWTVTAKDTNAPLLTANTGAGSVTAGGLGAGSYSVTVSGSSTNLTHGVNVLANPLLIATGNASAQIGNITTAGSVTSGAYSLADAAKFVPVTIAAQTIGTGIKTASFALNLYAYQEINALEAHRAGTYTLTITYTATASF
jgi:hypothetical protein